LRLLFEKRPIRQSVLSAGGAPNGLIAEPIAAAIRGRHADYDPTGNMIVDIGGGTTEGCGPALGDIVYGAFRCASEATGLDGRSSTTCAASTTMLSGDGGTASGSRPSIGTDVLPDDGLAASDVISAGRDLLNGDVPKGPRSVSAQVSEALSGTRADRFARR